MEKLQLKKEQIARIYDYSEVFNSDIGKRVLKDLELSFCGDCFVKGDSYATHVRIGENNVVLRIKEMLRYSEMEIEEEKEVDNLWPEKDK